MCARGDLDTQAIRDLREHLIDESTAEDLAETFKALSSSTRARIIAALLERELCVHDLATLLDMSHSAISHQLRVLRKMRLVRFTKDGRHVYYALDDEHIEHLFQEGLDHVHHE